MDRNEVSSAAVGQDLVAVLLDPARLFDLSSMRLDRVLRLARRTSTLPRLALLVEPLESNRSLDPKATELLLAARATAGHHRRNLLWEGNRIEHALAGLDVPIVALKGAAYELMGLPTGIGRMSSDFDVLVPLDRLGEVERALESAGWETDKPEPYDQRYYREWMHELPPLRHRDRGTLVDVHHTLVPRTTRTVRPDVDALWADSRPVDGATYRVLCPADLVVHCAVHAFHDGALDEAFRDLVDLDSLLRHFGENEPEYWDSLVARARLHSATRPLYYAIRFSREYFGTPVPHSPGRTIGSWAPSPGLVSWMDRWVRQVVFPTIGGPEPTEATIAAIAVFVRSHTLRMPARLLGPHLLRKLWRRFTTRKDGT